MTNTDLGGKLMRAILLVMLGSSKLAELLSRIQGLPAPAMQLIGGLMQEVSGWNAESDLHDEDSSNSNLGSQIGGEASKPMALLDPRAEVLQLEAQYATVISQLERRNRDYDSLDTEHQTLSDSFTRLQDTNVGRSVATFFNLLINGIGRTYRTGSRARRSIKAASQP